MQRRLTKVSFSVVLGLELAGYSWFRTIPAANTSLLSQRKRLWSVCRGNDSFLQIVALNLRTAGWAEGACSGLSPQGCADACVGGDSPRAVGSCGV